jgi:hypothetical protein
MPRRRKYLQRSVEPVVAVRLALDTDGFSYRKWGREQRCKQGDFIVDNAGEIYTVDADSFARTYAEIARGLYRKIAPVWAEQASAAGSIETKEGATSYRAGDYLVFNEEDGSDGYAMPRSAFETSYTPSHEGEP